MTSKKLVVDKPQFVEVMTFSELFQDVSSLGTRLQTCDYLSEGEYPIVDQGQSEIAGYTNFDNGVIRDVPVICFGDHSCSLKYVEYPFVIGADGVKVLKNKKAHPKFLFYWLQSCLKYIPDRGYARHFKWLKEFKCNLPSEKVQIHVVSVLDKINHEIRLLQKISQKIDVLVKSQFMCLIGTPKENPNKFPVVKIADLATDVRYGTSQSASSSGLLPYLRMNNITYDGKLDLTDLKYISLEEQDLPKYSVRKGDVLFNRTNSRELVGKTCVYSLDEAMVIAGYLIRVRLNDQMLPEVLSASLNSLHFKQLLRKIAKGAVGQANINAEELKQIRLVCPPIDVQRRFVDFSYQIDKSKFAVEQSIRKLELLKKSLMQQYFG